MTIERGVSTSTAHPKMGVSAPLVGLTLNGTTCRSVTAYRRRVERPSPAQPACTIPTAATSSHADALDTKRTYASSDRAVKSCDI